MSDYQFRTNDPHNRVSSDLGGSTAGLWLIFAGVALALIVLIMVFGSAPPADQASPAAPELLQAEPTAPAAPTAAPATE